MPLVGTWDMAKGKVFSNGYILLRFVRLSFALDLANLFRSLLFLLSQCSHSHMKPLKSRVITQTGVYDYSTVLVGQNTAREESKSISTKRGALYATANGI